MKKAMILLLATLLTVTLSGSASPATEIEEYKEYKSGDFTYTLDQSGNAEITGYRGDERDLTVPYEADGHPVTSIGDGAFWRCKGLSSVTLPEGLQSIGNDCFSECSGVTSIVLPKGLQTIGNGAFFSCIGLSSVTLPEGFQSIGDGAFFECPNLTSVTLPDSLISMGSNPFIGFHDLSFIHLSPNHPVFAVTDGVLFNKKDKILIAYPMTSKPGAYRAPSGTRMIGDFALWGCTGLTLAVLPEGLESIGEFAFSGCSGLESIELPQDLESIGTGAFNSCSSLESIVLPDGLKSIGDFVFWQCFELASVTLPYSLISMGANPFLEFHDLASVRVSPDHPVFSVTGGVLFNQKDKILIAYPMTAKTGAYQVPSGTRAIGMNAFWYCARLTSVVLPEGLESIGDYAFYSCSSLKSAELPEGLKSIGVSAFEECSHLVLTVPQDSYAQQYAQDNGIPYEVISK